MFLVILIIIALVLFFFLRDRDKMLSSSVDNAGGIKAKYAILIEALMASSSSKLTSVTRDGFKVECRMQTTYTSYEVAQNFGSTDIMWIGLMGLAGEHKKNWTFPEGTEQKKMIEVINADLEDLFNSFTWGL